MNHYMSLMIWGVVLVFLAQGGALAQHHDHAKGDVFGPEEVLPLAEPNDQRSPAGRMIDGELRVELEAVRAAWYPRGAHGPRIETLAFAEAGGPPQVPGPLIRVTAGTPVHVTIRNTLDTEIQVRGFLDRGTMEVQRPEGVPPIAPNFLFADSLVVPPGETREVRFTPTTEVTSFYFGRTFAPFWSPFGGDAMLEAASAGALVVDPAGAEPPEDERLIVISQYFSEEEGDFPLKLFFNGLSWPNTERFRYAVGDTVRWRVLNVTVSNHPMHLHGFHFSVDGMGDGDSDTLYSPEERRLVVTENLLPTRALRMTWVPEEPGNWLFHCHIVRHMNHMQRFADEGPLPEMAHDHDMEHMAGIVLGITVETPPGWDDADPEPVRRIDLWTGTRPNVFGDDPELGFVIQNGDMPPPADSTLVPGSPIVLHRGEPAEIVVHNRLEVPLSVHWHGLELKSLYDGVPHWSGVPGAVRAPIMPGESASVVIDPPRAGTFIYHVHGETAHELQQGLYGPFLVLEPGEEWDRELDRVYLLGAHGATLDAPPAINGHSHHPHERFVDGETYRLRFIHISPDESKVVRLLREGEPVSWRALAKDGADLQPRQQTIKPADIRLQVGETYDFEWTPGEEGIYVLEVRTNFYPTSGLPPAIQRVAFGVGEVGEEGLEAAVRTEPSE
jgi:manganese oxidase